VRKDTRSSPLGRRWLGIVLSAMAAVPGASPHTGAEAAIGGGSAPAVEREPAAANVIEILQRYGVRADEVLTWYTTTSDRASDARLRYRTAPVRPGAGKDARPAQRSPIEVVGARGVIDGGFYASLRGAGVPDGIISRLADLLGWEIDFTTDVQPGDRFRVLYERVIDGTPARILAADYVGRDRTVAAFRYEDGSHQAVYLDAQGRLLEERFLRYPVEFSHITSSFSDARLHPILNTRRPHLGVDFAAPVGTPVRAVGPGLVRAAGWMGGFGRHVEIDHGKGLVSTYSHLNGIRATVHPGARVKAGDVIGWVGQSGLATGPHLHFAVFRNAEYVNPLTTRWIPRGPTIDRRAFDRVRNALAGQLRDVCGSLPSAASSTPPILLSSFAQARRLGPVALTI